MVLMEKLAAAWARRESLHGDSNTTAYRLFHGHGEGDSALNVDRFGEALVLWLRRPEMVDLSAVTAFYQARLGPEVIVVKEGARDPGRLLLGSEPEAPLIVTEDGLSYAVDLLAAQNAGFFLDARPARQWLRCNSQDRRIANLFAYTGSLGVAARAGGARSIEHVDLQSGQLKRARLNHHINAQPVDDRDFQAMEVGRWLRIAVKKGRRFDGLILDPPPRTPHGRARFRRESLYRWGAQALNSGGWMLIFFNRRGADREAEGRAFLESVDLPMEQIWQGTSGVDFPEEAPGDRLSLVAYARP
ncbi:MAG: hypothetical protein CMH55_04780 [Myxococcales bacterium]|nr:hypothetical protein [Myxococcales bacterium]